jgi:hypothetical protein
VVLDKISSSFLVCYFISVVFPNSSVFFCLLRKNNKNLLLLKQLYMYIFVEELRIHYRLDGTTLQYVIQKLPRRWGEMNVPAKKSSRQKVKWILLLLLKILDAITVAASFHFIIYTQHYHVSQMQIVCLLFVCLF